MRIAPVFSAMTRVLLIEDSVDVLEALQFELEFVGYQVDVATNARSALAIAGNAPPDVIVSDLGLPDLDGCEFIKRLRSIPSLASVPAIALTGASLERDVNRALASGFTAHLTKPVEASEVARRIEQLTAKGLRRQAG